MSLQPLQLPKPQALVSGKFGMSEHGEHTVFHLEDARRVKIIADWTSADFDWDYYVGVEIDAGEREGEIEWAQAWVQAGTPIRIRVNHDTKVIEIFQYTL